MIGVWFVLAAKVIKIFMYLTLYRSAGFENMQRISNFA